MKLIERKSIKSDEVSVILEYGELTKEIAAFKKYIEDYGHTFSVYVDDKTLVRIRVCDILYFEAVGELVFAYTENKVYEVKMRLYRVEEILGSDIIRASKSFLVNKNHTVSLTPMQGGRLIATLDNGEKIIISRQYAKTFMERFIKGVNFNCAALPKDK